MLSQSSQYYPEVLKSNQIAQMSYKCYYGSILNNSIFSFKDVLYIPKTFILTTENIWHNKKGEEKHFMRP